MLVAQSHDSQLSYLRCYSRHRDSPAVRQSEKKIGVRRDDDARHIGVPQMWALLTHRLAARASLIKNWAALIACGYNIPLLKLRLRMAEVATYTIIPRRGVYWIEATDHCGKRQLIEKFDAEEAAVSRLRQLEPPVRADVASLYAPKLLRDRNSTPKSKLPNSSPDGVS